ncbi:hypothetical protein [Pedobacter sp. L105]|uniref:hypothetical protein n=1 Tax=Pedobacter sp. L105 TaxID=1641871 RepID=UPI00131D63AD|nr:hypothetical protein [Pedobacter sp. L105]
MNIEKKYYYQVDLTVALTTSEFVFGYINISHIPYFKFMELFKDQVVNEKFLFDDSLSYFIDEELYIKHKEFFDKEIPFAFDFGLFEYSVSLSSVDAQNYQKNYYEELPPLLT